MYIGSAAYTIAFLLMAVSKRSDSYWAFYFPAFILNVMGADLEFNVANVGPQSCFTLTYTDC